MKKGLIIILLLIVKFSFGQQFTNLEGYYYNQTPPSDSAVVFAPGIFSLTDRLESNIAFSPDGKECYFGVIEIKDNKASYKIYSTQYINNKWTEQLESSFSVGNDVSNPSVSADGKRLYFIKDGDVYMVEPTLEGWGEPQALPSPINSASRETSYMESTDGVAYISSKRPDGFGGYDIWCIQPMPDQVLLEENLGPILNSTAYDISPLIAPDGSYLIFGSERYGRSGKAHLYISFNEDNGEWTTPINMNSSGAKINNETAHHSGPSLSPDGKFLFFRRHESMMEMDVYWFSAKIIYEIKEEVTEVSEYISADRPDEFVLMQNYPNPFNPTTNIRFGVKENTNIQLIIYNSLGELVQELLNQNMNSGYYEITWDASKLPSGIYFYRLQSGLWTETKKLILLR